METEVVSTPEAFWIAFVEDSVKLGYGTTLVPVSGLSKIAAIEVAIQLKVSLLIKGRDYLFSRTREGTLVHMGKKVTQH